MPPELAGGPGGSDGKESACNVEDLDSTPGFGRSPGEGNSYPLQYSWLGKSMDCIPWSGKESDITEQFLPHMRFQLYLIQRFKKK